MAAKDEEQENLYNNLISALDILPDLIILKDADRRWVKVNKLVLEVFKNL